MSYRSPEVRLRALAMLNTVMLADFGNMSSPLIFRWYNQQLNQNQIGQLTPGSCITVTRVSTMRDYNMGGPMSLSQPRLQLDIYDLDSETCRRVADDVITFMATVNLADALTTHAPCILINQMQRMLPNPTSPAGPVWVQMLEYRIYNDEQGQ
jgi:hypothetical protein